MAWRTHQALTFLSGFTSNEGRFHMDDQESAVKFNNLVSLDTIGLASQGAQSKKRQTQPHKRAPRRVIEFACSTTPTPPCMRMRMCMSASVSVTM